LVWEKRRFFDFDSLPWQRRLKNPKKLNEVSKPLHLSTNPEILPVRGVTRRVKLIVTGERVRAASNSDVAFFQITLHICK